MHCIGIAHNFRFCFRVCVLCRSEHRLRCLFLFRVRCWFQVRCLFLYNAVFGSVPKVDLSSSAIPKEILDTLETEENLNALTTTEMPTNRNDTNQTTPEADTDIAWICCPDRALFLARTILS
jgi:hypothetical protein